MPRAPKGVFFRASRASKPGKRDGVWYARLVVTDPNRLDPATGKPLRREFKRSAPTQALAVREYQQLVEQYGGGVPDGDVSTFAQLADYYTREFVREPVYRDNHRISGLASHRTVRMVVNELKRRFGNRRLRSITYDDLRRDRTERLETPVVRQKKDGSAGQSHPRAVASVNREFAILRAMLRIAVRQKWLNRSPFDDGPSLVVMSAEKARDRVLSQDEEMRLLEAIDADPQRSHLRPLFIGLLDTGCRKNELLRLRWTDVDMKELIFTVAAENSKTRRARVVPISERLAAEWRLMRVGAAANGLVYGGLQDVKRSFATACKKARVFGLRLHDLRHTAGTRLAASGLDLSLVARILGHSDIRTSYRYVNSGSEVVDAARRHINAFNAGSGRDTTSTNQLADAVN
jgi:integrase